MMHHRNGLNSTQKKILQGQSGAPPPIEPIRRNCQDLSSIIEGLNDEQTVE